jgi:tetratricopeptide (TPR) repeat protein
MLTRSTCLLLVALASGFGQQHTHAAEPKETGPAPLLDGLGHLHHAIMTASSQAQRYFDQGLTLIYGFNHEEAARSFRYAAKLDPKCAIAYWGVALAVGPNYNEPEIDRNRLRQAREAIQQAVSLEANAGKNEQAYINALAKRYSNDPKADVKQLAVNYKQAMGEVVKRYPEDLDAATLYAESAMDLHPWQLWKPDGQPEAGTVEILDVLRSVLKRDTNHLGANHFYIHATEAGPHPEQALDSASRLAGLAPGAGHLVHMPAHTYIRTGDYHSASTANQQAAAVDETYFNRYRASGMYPVMYYMHNLHFLAVSSGMEGRFADADRAAVKTVANATPYTKNNPMAEWYLPTQTFVLIRFRKWPELQKLREPDKNLHLAHAVWHFGRAMAYSGSGQLDKAKAERDAMGADTKALPKDAMLGFNSAHQLLDMAGWMIDANIARAQRNYKQAAALLAKAAQAEDQLNYDEPPDWYLPPRESLGAVLFLDGRHADAEAAFRAELKAHVKNPRALFGLAECLRAQNKSAEAASVRKEFDGAWRNADTQLRMTDL